MKKKRCNSIRWHGWKKLFLMMRITVFFILLGFLQVSASVYSQQTNLALKLEKSSIETVLKNIEEQSKFYFLYRSDLLKEVPPVSIQVNGAKLEEILDRILIPNGFVYEIEDRVVVIKKATEKAVPVSVEQQKTISGVVKDNTGAPLPGASVIVKGTTIGTITDFEGNFKLSIPNDAKTLIFSFVGTIPQEVLIGNKIKISVTLEEQNVGLEEVVAVGYATQKKGSVVGSIAQVDEEDLKRSGNVTDLRQALSGNLPGIVSLTSSGEPGGILTGESSTNIFIRGQNTWNGGQPLILVDGVERDMNNIDVNEVATISVLKDASATAVFGVKGANGVILITTKRGTDGKTKLNFNYTTTGTMLSRQPEKLDSYAAMMAKNEIIEREGVLNEPSWSAYVPYDIVTRYRLPQSQEYAAIYPNVDWEEAMFKNMGLSHRATLSAQGGSRAIQYFGSLAYMNETDLFKDYDNGKGYSPNYNYNRFNFRSNIDIRLTNTTKFKINLSGYYSLKNTNYNNEGSTSRADAWMWRATYGLAPNLFLPMYEDGKWGAYQEGGNNTANPIAVVYNMGIRQTRATELNSDFSLEQDLSFITKGLNAKASVFYDNDIRSQGGIYDVQNHVRPNEAATNVAYKQIYPMKYTGPGQDPSEYTVYLPVSTEEYGWVLRPWTINQEGISAANWTSYIPVDRRLMYQFQLNYANNFGKNNVTAMGVFKREEFARGSMFKNYREDWVFRTTYDYDSRYLFEVNGAYNGSEQFGPGYRFDFFPSAAIGWMVTNEEFFKVRWIEKLKLKFSMGKVGDDKVSGSRWLYDSQFAYGGTARLNEASNGSSIYPFYRESVIGNPLIQWENALKTNYGFETGLFKNQIAFNFDYFTEDRTDILLGGGSRNIPPFFGGTPPSANIGHVKSKGFEIELNYTKKLSSDVSIWSTLAITHNENKIIERDDAPLQFEYLKYKGYPIGQQRSLVKTNFYNNWDEVFASIPTENNDLQKLPGYYDLIDFNADGIIKTSEDTPPVGYSEVPQNSANLSLGASYKGLSVMIQFYGVNNANRIVAFNNYGNDIDIVYSHAEDYWSKDNPNAASFLPRWKTQAENVGDYFMYDSSFLRLKTAEISYNFSDAYWVKTAGFSNLKLFLNGNNLFFWSKLPDDRETTYSGGSATEGAYPTVKRINLGIELTF